MRWPFRDDLYYSFVWAKIKGAWTIPENLLKEMVDIETIIVVIIDRDGKIQKFWFEKSLAMLSTIRVQCEPLKRQNPYLLFPKN